MLVDRSLRLALRNYSTLFLIAATVVYPLHLAHGYYYRQVFAVRDIHPAIEEFPSKRQVKDVSRAELEQARTLELLIGVVELLLLPLVAAAALRVVRIDDAGGVPTALGSWRGIGGLVVVAQAVRRPGTIAGAVLSSVVVGWLLRAIGLILMEPVPDQWNWLAAAVVEASAEAAAAPFLLAGIAVAALSATADPSGKTRARRLR